MRERWILFASILLISTSVVVAQPRTVERKSADSPATKEPLKKERIEGKVKSIDKQTAIVRTKDGRDVKVNLGPQDYWEKNGHRLHEGDDITVQGWRHDGDDDRSFFAGGIWGPGWYFRLTNDDGYPDWAPQDDYWAGWYPTYDYYQNFYWGMPPWAWGPPPGYWGPPPPRYWHRHRQPPPPPPDWRGHHRRHHDDRD